MKMVYSYRFIIYLSFFGIVFFSAAAITCMFLLINNILDNKANMIIVYSILLIEFSCFIPLFLLILNRFGCKIIYNEEKQIIIRKGFICGYEYCLRIEDIKEIIIASFPKETTYYIFIDSYNTKYDGGSKKSFIRIEKTEQNLDFIKKFWNKPIEEYKLEELFS